MTPLQYQKELARFDERVAFHKAKAQEFEHKRADFVLSVLEATNKAQEESKEEPKAG
jgi:hypothetical protein